MMLDEEPATTLASEAPGAKHRTDWPPAGRARWHLRGELCNGKRKRERNGTRRRKGRAIGWGCKGNKRGLPLMTAADDWARSATPEGAKEGIERERRPIPSSEEVIGDSTSSLRGQRCQKPEEGARSLELGSPPPGGVGVEARGFLPLQFKQMIFF